MLDNDPRSFGLSVVGPARAQSCFDIDVDYTSYSKHSGLHLLSLLLERTSAYKARAISVVEGCSPSCFSLLRGQERLPNPDDLSSAGRQ